MNYFDKKMEVTISLKRFLEKYGFAEVSTPVMRRDGGDFIHRIKVQDIDRYLRDSHELQLRWLLTSSKSVYEIGPCFRLEDTNKSDTNMTEFLLMELFTSKYDLSSLKGIVKSFIESQKPHTVFEEISISEHIKEQFGIDLSYNGSQEKLYAKLKERYGDMQFKFGFEYVMHYIETEIEVLSRGKVVFFTDYPECTCSYANIKCGDIISRFELFTDGLEIANGFDDECNAERFIVRNKEAPIFNNEELATANALRENKLPCASAGVGIGIERLCMFLFGINDISEFSFPSKSF